MRIDPTASRSRRVRLVAGFTLPELMIAMTIFIFLVIGIVSANIFGLRLFQVAQNRLGSRESMSGLSYSREMMDPM